MLEDRIILRFIFLVVYFFACPCSVDLYFLLYIFLHVLVVRHFTKNIYFSELCTALN